MSLITTSWLHDGSIGDVWASLPAVKEYWRKTGNQAIIYLTNGRKAIYYDGAIHPTTDAKGEQVMLNETVINMMIPLLKSQEYIKDAFMWSNQPINFDLNKIRETYVGMPGFCISRWYFYVFPDLSCDLSTKWITVPETDKDFAKGKILVSRTERYTNEKISYSFLKKYENDVLFVGTMLEYMIFKYRFGLNIGRLEIENFLELAQAIKQCKFHISNQTQAFQISQGLKVPRIVELCRYAPNVIVIGEDAYDFFAQEALEYYVKTLYNKKAPESEA